MVVHLGLLNSNTRESNFSTTYNSIMRCCQRNLRKLPMGRSFLPMASGGHECVRFKIGRTALVQRSQFKSQRSLFANR